MKTRFYSKIDDFKPSVYAVLGGRILKLQKDKLKLSDLVHHYSKILEEHGDMELATFCEGHYDEDNWWCEDSYESVDSIYIGYLREVYLYDGFYATDLPYDNQKTDKRKLYIIDEI